MSNQNCRCQGPPKWNPILEKLLKIGQPVKPDKRSRIAFKDCWFQRPFDQLGKVHDFNPSGLIDVIFPTGEICQYDYRELDVDP